MTFCDQEFPMQKKKKNCSSTCLVEGLTLEITVVLAETLLNKVRS